MLIERNKKHFAQANDALFADDKRGQHLGGTGTGATADSVIDGTCACKLEELEAEVREWLKESRQPKHMPDINVAISLEDHVKGFKSAKNAQHHPHQDDTWATAEQSWKMRTLQHCAQS